MYDLQDICSEIINLDVPVYVFHTLLYVEMLGKKECTTNYECL